MNALNKPANCVNSSTTGQKLSLLAQLVALYAEKGVTTTKEIALLTGRSERQVWRAKSELHPDTGDSHPVTHDTVTHDRVARAYKESTLRVDSSSVVVSDSNSESIITNFTTTLPARSKKESPPPPAQPKKTLSQQLAAADDSEASDEDRFWAAVDVLAKAGVPRSQLVKLGKLTEAFDECLVTLRTVAGAREPTRYLSGVIRNLKAEAEAATGFGVPGEPEFVREYRRYGYDVSRLEGGKWRCGMWIFDATGEEIGC